MYALFFLTFLGGEMELSDLKIIETLGPGLFYSPFNMLAKKLAWTSFFNLTKNCELWHSNYNSSLKYLNVTKALIYNVNIFSWEQTKAK